MALRMRLARVEPPRTALVERCPAEIPRLQHDINMRPQFLPIMLGEAKSRVMVGAEGEAFLGGWFCAQGSKVSHGQLITLLEPRFMAWASGSDSEVIGQAPRSDSQRFHESNPWMEREASEHHAEGASLRNTARFKVGRSQALSNGVVVE